MRQTNWKFFKILIWVKLANLFLDVSTLTDIRFDPFFWWYQSYFKKKRGLMVMTQAHDTTHTQSKTFYTCWNVCLQLSLREKSTSGASTKNPFMICSRIYLDFSRCFWKHNFWITLSCQRKLKWWCNHQNIACSCQRFLSLFFKVEIFKTFFSPPGVKYLWYKM